MVKKICVIPARMGSSRFPGKPLEKLLGLTLIEHVWQRCEHNDLFDKVIVATCDQEIFDCIENAGGTAIMTADTHERCTDRVSEAIDKYEQKLEDDDLILMVQGDEILVNADLLDRMIKVYEDTKAPAVNLISRLYNETDHVDPNIVKAVTDLKNQMVFLSRAGIPSSGRTTHELMYQQTGVIAFSAKFLQEFSVLEQTPMEIIESVDMLRLIEHSIPLYAVKTDIETIGVDTPADLKRAETVLKTDEWTKHYLSV